MECYLSYGGVREPVRGHKKKKERGTVSCGAPCMAATYFSTNKRSIIGDAGLNFSVRNGKRCAPAL